ncbi:zinc ribbon domain-containing protein [Streptomyces sp. NBC_01476]|uniref:FmdB family zinc ribbon protein n=1 Tax=Streptomyces sp. NBC_01476 TaxID=2903881 RepID=UPI002E312AD7|nr:zinc ribbon domain-containing protein [Streptomyces sp. NBC_01476]
MPRYEYRCKTCETTFELRRPMSQANAPAPCPKGHPEAVKLLSTVSVGASVGSSVSSGSSGSSASSVSPAPAAGGGCCGGGCCN